MLHSNQRISEIPKLDLALFHVPIHCLLNIMCSHTLPFAMERGIIAVSCLSAMLWESKK